MVPESGSIDPHFAPTNVPAMYGLLSAVKLSSVSEAICDDDLE